LIVYEQIFRNAYNPNKALGGDHRKSVMPTTSNAEKISVESIKNIITMGMRSTTNVELNVTLLQLLCLICEQKKILEKDELQVITVSVIQCFYEENTMILNANIRKSIFFIVIIFGIVQEICALCVLIRIVELVGPIKTNDDLIDIILTKDFLNMLKEMYAKKPYLCKYIECLLNRISQCPVYYKFITSDCKFEVFFLI